MECYDCGYYGPPTTVDYVLIIFITLIIPLTVVIFCLVSWKLSRWEEQKLEVNPGSNLIDEPSRTFTGHEGTGFETDARGNPGDNGNTLLQVSDGSHQKVALCMVAGPGNRTFWSKVVLRPLPTQETAVFLPNVVEELLDMTRPPQSSTAPHVLEDLPPSYDEIAVGDRIPPTYSSLSGKNTLPVQVHKN